MKGDFSRLTFDPSKNYVSVLMQQGRVQLDADWNEQAAILLWQIRTLARAVIGDFGGTPQTSFQISKAGQHGLQVAAGTYFVHGIPCENAADSEVAIPDCFRSKAKDTPDGSILNDDYQVYLAVWERLITYLDDPEIREPALGDGVDTAVRVKTLCRVVVRSKTKEKSKSAKPSGLPLMKVSLTGPAKATDLCNISPDSQYRGGGNQLYRIEIHDVSDGPMFKWSRENASLVYPVTKVDGTKLTLQSAGRDDRLKIHPGDYVEFESSEIAWDEALPLGRVKDAASDELSITVDAVPSQFKSTATNHAAVRRWDHSPINHAGLTKAEEGMTIAIEAGIQVEFTSTANCRRGDYWLIPARAGVNWTPPGDPRPAIRPEHYLAPLSSFTVSDGGIPDALKDLRSVITPIAKPVG